MSSEKRAGSCRLFFVQHRPGRAPIQPKTQQVGVAILGAGFGDLCLEVKLREAGNFLLWSFSTWSFWLEIRTANPDDFNFVRCAALPARPPRGESPGVTRSG